MILTEEGIIISIKTVSRNASFAICDNLELDSNLPEESNPHLEKQFSPNTSTDEGIIISIKPVPLNAHSSICDNLAPDSNATELSGLHAPKHLSPTT
jgi:hypothetical protein